MTIEMRSKSQVTIPREVVSELSLSEGDKFDVRVKNGTIFLIPVAVYPKSYVSALEKAAGDAVNAYRRGELTAYDNAQELIAALHAEVDE
ncbi:MAG: AbrB/MazE/SpoVT family DNA-binding domain-containing protein [Defluviitaleaceae bacterium]|nr:AbrB/MazE/SpoVT family DNA-binding domain-containing protein [Defluviitaleaceae bacterium]